MTTTTVFVSGATGFIAQHIVTTLLEKGYSVVGSVRSAEKGANLNKLLNSDKFTYEVVKALEEEGAFDEALRRHPEVTVFLHTASPFHFNTSDPERDLLIPAVHGTQNALKAIQKYGPQIKRVVITSSYAAMVSMESDMNGEYTADESSWNDITWEIATKDPIAGYYGSKTFAERAAWDFVEKERPGFILSTVNPVFVFGPQAFSDQAKGTLNTSSEIINQVLKSKPGQPFPDYKGNYIDVRDVALAHISAFEKEEAKNQRLFTTNGRFTTHTILTILHSKFPQLSEQLPAADLDSLKEYSNNVCKINNDKTRSILGFEFINLEKSVVDSVQQILDANK